MLKNTHMHIFFGAEKPTHMVRTYLYVKYIEYPPRDATSTFWGENIWRILFYSQTPFDPQIVETWP